MESRLSMSLIQNLFATCFHIDDSVCSRTHCQRFSPSQISDTPRAGIEPAQNLSPGFAEWNCALVNTTKSRRHRK